MGHFQLKLGRRFSLQAPDVSVLLEETQRFREHLALLDCPSCAEKALKLVNYVQGPTGGQAVSSVQTAPLKASSTVMASALN